MIRSFELLAGKHHTNGKTFSKGQIVQSEHDLVKLFPNKFKEIVSTSPSPALSKPPIPGPVGISAGAVATDTAAPAGVRVQVENIPVQHPEDHPKYGKDVTSEFPKATILHFKVYQKGDQFKIVDGQSMMKLNQKKLLTPDRVNDFLSKSLDQ